jgi:hypothetical protein
VSTGAYQGAATAVGADISFTVPAKDSNGVAFDYIRHSYSATPAPGRILITDGAGTTHMDMDILLSGHFVTPAFLVTPPGLSATVTLKGASGATGKLGFVPWYQ